jgi:hypothetical protein
MGARSDEESAGEVDELIRRFVQLCHLAPNWASAINALEDDGIDAELADRLTVFVPLAFARVLLGALPVTWPANFSKIRRDGTLQEGLPLMSEPIFAHTMILGRELAQSEFGRTVMKIASTSVEFKVIKQAQQKGTKFDSLLLLPPLIAERGVAPPVHERALQELAARAKAEHARMKGAKSWWRIW